MPEALFEPRHLQRRQFLLHAAAMIAMPLASHAQERAMVARVGVLTGRSTRDGAPFVEAFRQGMRDLGWVEGKNLVIDDRWAEGRSDRFEKLANELVHLKVDAIVAGNTVAAVAAKTATSTIPIIMASVADPEGIGLVRSLARPGGNVTGLSYGVGTAMFTKQLEVLKEAVPTIGRVAVLVNPLNRAHILWRKDVTAVPRFMGVQLQFVEVRSPEDFDRAFADMARERAEGLLALADTAFVGDATRLQALAARGRLPGVFGSRIQVQAGGLMSYGVDIRDNFRRAAAFVDRVLEGAKPAELPVEQPTKFELIINESTASALGLKIPQSLLLRADEVIR